MIACSAVHDASITRPPRVCRVSSLQLHRWLWPPPGRNLSRIGGFPAVGRRLHPYPTAFLVLALLALYWAPISAEAAWIESLGQSARAIAMGNAYTAVSDDLSAVWYNPAGLTQLIGGRKVDQHLGVGLTTIEFHIKDINSPSGTLRYDSVVPANIVIPRRNMGWAINDWLYLAPIPLSATFSGVTAYPENTGNARFSGYYTSNVYMHLMPRAAVRISKTLSFGAGVDINALNQVKNQTKLGDGYLLGAAAYVTGEDALLQPPLAGLFLDGQDDGKLLIRTDEEFPTGLNPINDMNLNFRDFGYQAGLLWKPRQWLRLGLKYRSEMKVDVEGQVDLVVNPNDPLVRLTQGPLASVLPKVGNDSERFETTMTLPRQVSVGIALQPTDSALVAVDYLWTDWGNARRRDTISVKGDGLGAAHFREINAIRNWNSVHAVRTGMELRILEQLYLRAGFTYDPSPVPDAYWDMGSGFGDYFIYSAGLGMSGLFKGRLDIDTYFQYLMSGERNIEVGESRNLGGTRYFRDPAAGERYNTDFGMEIDGGVYSFGLCFSLH